MSYVSEHERLVREGLIKRLNRMTPDDRYYELKRWDRVDPGQWMTAQEILDDPVALIQLAEFISAEHLKNQEAGIA